MSKLTETKKRIITKLDVIKKTNDDSTQERQSSYDNFLNNVDDLDKKIGGSLDGFLNKIKTKKNNKSNIFSDLLDLSNSFISANEPILNGDKLMSTNRLKKHAENSVKNTLKASKSIISDNVKNYFFINEGICGGDTPIEEDVIRISPKEFDFLNILTMDPSSSMGSIIYEGDEQNNNKVKFNRHLYEAFNSPFEFISTNNKHLFDISWVTQDQEYEISNLKQGEEIIKAGDFIDDYYSSIETVQFSNVVKTALLLTVQGDGTETKLFNSSLNNLERLLNKLFTLCPQNNPTIKESNPTALFNEDDILSEEYFDFNNIEGIDIDNEDARLRKVLKFKDCENYEIPVDTTIMEDFSYLATTKNYLEKIESSLQQSALNACEESGGRFKLEDLSVSIKNSYILNLPKALIAQIIGPKVFFPIVVLVKQLKKDILNTINGAMEFMKALSKLFTKIITELFNVFVKSFWGFLKPDLIKFLTKIGEKILKEKYRKYVKIIKSLIRFLTDIIESNSCDSLFGGIEKVIDNVLVGNKTISIPNLLLTMARFRDGFSDERAILNIVENLEKMGISTAPIYGENNNLIALSSAIVKGIKEEEDTNGKKEGTNLPVRGPGFYIPGGIISIVSI
jgi:hypothetical protein